MNINIYTNFISVGFDSFTARIIATVIDRTSLGFLDVFLAYKSGENIHVTSIYTYIIATCINRMMVTNGRMEIKPCKFSKSEKLILSRQLKKEKDNESKAPIRYLLQGINNLNR